MSVQKGISAAGAAPERTPEQQAAIDRAKNPGRSSFRNSLNLTGKRSESERTIPYHARMGVRA